MRMKVNTHEQNNALLELISNPAQILFLDANFFIPPDRTNLGARRKFDFAQFKSIWLDPLFNELHGLSIHESVYDEFVTSSVKEYANKKIESTPNKLQVFYDNMLSEIEKILYQTHIINLSQNSKYLPDKDNKDDRGEVKTLSYMAVKGFMYFASNDNLSELLIENAADLQTGLEDISLLHYYDLIFFLYKKGYDKNYLRAMYKYLYRLTKQEKDTNPEWGEFVTQMEYLYRDIFQSNSQQEKA